MDKRNDSGGKVLSGFLWRFLERFSYQIITLAVTVLLQRLLDPEMYGIVSKVTVITAILLVFVDSGMASALIQKKDPDDLDFSSVFYFNMAFCLLLYLGLYTLAPRLAVLLKEEGLVPVMRVLGLTLIVSGLKNVQEAYVRKTMRFKLFFRSTIGGTVFSGALGIFLALRGYGVWALVWQQLSNVTVNTVILWFTVGWRPKRMFSLQRLKGLFHYGVKLLGASLLDVGYQKIYPLIIGVTEGNAEMAFFEKGQHYPNTANDLVMTTMDGVLLPAMAEEQGEKERLREMTRRAIQLGSFVVMPLMAGFAACAEPLVRHHLRLYPPASGKPQRHQGGGGERNLPDPGDPQAGAGGRGAHLHRALRTLRHGPGASVLGAGLPWHQRLAEQENSGLFLPRADEGYSAHRAAVYGDGMLRLGGIPAGPFGLPDASDSDPSGGRGLRPGCGTHETGEL